MGTIIVGGALLVIVALIIFNIIRKVRQGKSAFCTSSSCDCGCGAGALCSSHVADHKKDHTASCCCSEHHHDNRSASCHCESGHDHHSMK